MQKAEVLKGILLFSPWAIIFLFSFLPVMLKVFNGNREPNKLGSLMYGLMGLACGAGLLIALRALNISGGAFSNAIVFDNFVVVSGLFICFAGMAGLILAYDHIATNSHQFAEFVFLYLCSIFGMGVLISANDLMVMFLGIETMSLCLYILVAMSREATLSKEAAFKYFILGSFASAIFLYGVALIYGACGSTYLPKIAEKATELLGQDRLFMVGLVLVILGFGFKVSMFPFHAWTPDVYQGAATPLTTFMATAVKVASFLPFIRIMNSPAFSQSSQLLNVMTVMAVFTMLVGNIGAIVQNNVKRMLAYSSIAHSGYILIGLISAGFGAHYLEASADVLFYLVTYGFMTVGSFALISVFERYENSVITFDDLRGLPKKHPWLAASLSVLLLSLAGIPPTLGFFAKFKIFANAIDQEYYWLAFWGAINSVISVYFYLRPIVVMYMSEGDLELEKVGRSSSAALVTAMAIIVGVLGVFSNHLSKWVSIVLG